MLKPKLGRLKRFIRPRQMAALAVLGILIGLSQAHPLFAQSVAQGYKSDENLQRGMIVMLDKDDNKKVKALTNEEITRMLGVVIEPNDSTITISGSDKEFYVANTGRYLVLVSDQNGSIDQEEYVTISSIAGVGMRTSNSQPFVLGKAITSFDAKTGILSSTKIKDSKGVEQTVNIGLITIDVNITRNPSLKVDANVPDALRKASTVLVQKQVAANRIYIGLVILVISSIIAGIVLYAGVRSSIIALGRNPLSKKTIIRSLIQVIITSVIIFLLGLFGVYLLLKF